jgi:hypothetical protein
MHVTGTVVGSVSIRDMADAEPAPPDRALTTG